MKKSLLWYSSWSDEQFYGKFKQRGAKKAFSSELFNSIIAEFKEGLENVQFKEKKTLMQKRKKPNWWSKSKRFFEKPRTEAATRGAL